MSSDPLFSLLRDLSLKSALLLLVAGAPAAAMRRASAAVRHLVWLLTFAGLLGLPLLSVTLPVRTVPVLPQVAVTGLPTIIAPPPATLLPVAPLPRPVASRQPARPSIALSWPTRLCLLWLGGVGLALVPLGAGWVMALARLRKCVPVTDPDILALSTDVRGRMGVGRLTALRFRTDVAVPMTLGLVRPTILLPMESGSWPAERLRVALLHEYAHVRRGDWATQTLARILCAAYWHNPLVWLAARRLRAEAEQACDDLVLAAGIPAPDYAAHLLAVAQAASRPSWPPAVPMAHRAGLESRLRAILAARPHRAPSRPQATAAFIAALGIVIPLSMLRLAARAAQPLIRQNMQMAARSRPLPKKNPRTTSTAIKIPIPGPLTVTGDQIMKPPNALKTAALAALAASLTLTDARARNAAPPLPAVLTVEHPLSTPPGSIQTQTIALHHVRPSDILRRLPWDQDPTLLPDGVQQVSADIPGNAFTVVATQQGFTHIQRIIRILDVQHNRVQLKFALARTTDTRLAEFGINFASNSVGVKVAYGNVAAQIFTALKEQGAVFASPTIVVTENTPTAFRLSATDQDIGFLVQARFYPDATFTLHLENRLTPPPFAPTNQVSRLQALERTVPEGQTLVYSLPVPKDEPAGDDLLVFVTPTILPPQNPSVAEPIK